MINQRQKFIRWLFGLNRSKKRLIQITYDSFAASIAFLIALSVRFETIDFFYLFDTYIGFLIAVSSTTSIFVLLGLYNKITRYVSIDTAISIAFGSILSFAVLLSCILLFNLNIPISVSLIFGINLCMLLGGIRIFIRYISQNSTKKNRENIAIYGAGPSGIQLMDALRQNPNYSVKLFIDDSSDLDGKNISGIDIIN